MTNFILERLPELWLRTGEHILLTGLSTACAVVVGMPLGILASRRVWLRGPVLSVVGILQTIPSLAMLAILLALLHKIGEAPAIIALILYALLPIVRNTLTGIEGVSPEASEAARGIGMTDRQQLWMVELPLALPVIVAGIRTAAVAGVGIATLSAFIGAGGLGQFINRGLALSDTRLILLGAIPAALLALLVDAAIGAAGSGLRPVPTTERASLRRRARPLTVSLPIIMLAVGFLAYVTGSSSSVSPCRASDSRDGTIRIGSKNFTEQIILGELMAQMIEAHTDIVVERKFNLGGTMICHGAMVNEQIDLYAEYTGTALTAILNRVVIADPDEALNNVRQAYRDQFDIEWLEPFGFNNTYTITVRKQDADRYGWKNISGLASRSRDLRAGFTAEFAERPDGYPGLRQHYGYAFGEVRDLDPAIMYEAIANDEVDVICAFATDGRIAAYELQPLNDDLGFFPPYRAAPVIRSSLLLVHPDSRGALAPLAGLIQDEAMQRLNFEVDGNGRTPEKVVREFLTAQALLE